MRFALAADVLLVLRRLTLVAVGAKGLHERQDLVPLQGAQTEQVLLTGRVETHKDVAIDVLRLDVLYSSPSPLGRGGVGLSIRLQYSSATSSMYLSYISRSWSSV